MIGRTKRDTIYYFIDLIRMKNWLLSCLRKIVLKKETWRVSCQRALPLIGYSLIGPQFNGERSSEWVSFFSFNSKCASKLDFKLFVGDKFKF